MYRLKSSKALILLSIGDLAPDVAAAKWQSAYGGRRIAPGSIVQADIKKQTEISDFWATNITDADSLAALTSRSRRAN